MNFIFLYWKHIAIAAFTAALLAYTYHAGGEGPRAELKALQAASEAYKQESIKIAKEKDNEYKNDVAAVRAGWAAYRLRKPAVKTARVATNVCDNEAGNRIVSDSVTEYLKAVGRFRSEAESLLERADQQQAQLSCAVEWAGTINR